MSSHPTLLSINEDALGKIMEHLDFEAMITLRKTCKTLRTFLDSTTPDIKLQSIRITVNCDSICIHYEDVIFVRDVTYRNNGSFSCFVEVGIHEKRIERMDYLKAFEQDFAAILKFQKSVLGHFEVTVGSVFTRKTTVTPFSKIFGKVQKSLGRTLKTRKVEIGGIKVGDEQFLISILQFSDPKFVEKLRISGEEGQEGCLKIDVIQNLDQWKNLRILEVQEIRISGKLENMMHFLKLSISMESVNSEELIMLKEKFLDSSSKNESFHINFKIFDDKDTFLDSFPLLPKSRPTTDKPQSMDRYFRIAGTDNFVHIVLNSRSIEFDRIQLEKIPNYHYLIQNGEI